MNTAGPQGRTLAESWKATQRALDHAIDFVDEKLAWSRRALIPSTNALIVLAAAMDRSEFKIDTSVEELYRRWLCFVALRGVFQGSVETTMNRFLRELKSAKRGDQALLRGLRKAERRNIQADELNRMAGMWGPATQVLHAYLSSEGARDWLSGDELNKLARVDRASFPSGDLTVHHIFPRNVLASILDDPAQANRLANYALLSRATNSEFKNRSADDVLRVLTPEQKRWAEVQFFGESAGDRLDLGQFEEFCRWRSQRLADVLNSYLGL